MIQAAENAQENPAIYAQIARWAILRLCEPDQKPTLHITGYIAMHSRFVADVGAPYVGTRLNMLDLDMTHQRTSSSTSTSSRNTWSRRFMMFTTGTSTVTSGWPLQEHGGSNAARP
jgi:hypothetical protein